MNKQVWWMGVVVLSTVSVVSCSKSTNSSKPDAGTSKTDAGNAGTGGSGGAGGTAGAAGKAGAGGASGMTGAIAMNVPCGPKTCAGAAPSTMMMPGGFAAAQVCCLDSTAGTCGTVSMMDSSCQGKPKPDPRCPMAFGQAGCCTAGNQCGIDASTVGYGCLGLDVIAGMGAGNMIPAPRRCDAPPDAGMPDQDAGH